MAFPFVDYNITAEFFEPSGCIVDFVHSKGDRHSVKLEDDDHDTCIQPFKFGNQRYLARKTVPYKRLRIVQISGWNITCQPLQGMAVYVTSDSNVEGVTVVRCKEILPFGQTEQGQVLCSYKCPCHHGCHLVFMEVSKKPDADLERQICEVRT